MQIQHSFLSANVWHSHRRHAVLLFTYGERALGQSVDRRTHRTSARVDEVKEEGKLGVGVHAYKANRLDYN